MSAAAAKAATEAAEMAKCKAAIKEMLEVNNRPYNGLPLRICDLGYTRAGIRGLRPRIYPSGQQCLLE